MEKYLTKAIHMFIKKLLIEKPFMKCLSKIQNSDFCQKSDLFFGFSIVAQPNQGVQLKDRLF